MKQLLNLTRPALKRGSQWAKELFYWRRPIYTVGLYAIFYNLVQHYEWMPAAFFALLLFIMLQGQVYSAFVLKSGLARTTNQVVKRQSRAVPLLWLDCRRPRHSVLVLIQASARQLLELVEGCVGLLQWQDRVSSSICCVVFGMMLLLSISCHTSTLMTISGVVGITWYLRPCVRARRIVQGLMRWLLNGCRNQNLELLEVSTDTHKNQ